MTLSLVGELLTDVREQAYEECLWRSEALIESQLGPDGSAFGDDSLDRAQRIDRFVDMANRGVLDALQAISPKWAQAFVAQYQKDLAASPLVTQDGGAS